MTILCSGFCPAWYVNNYEFFKGLASVGCFLVAAMMFRDLNRKYHWFEIRGDDKP